jgi:ABC-type glycerol-3-phosphate transport system permease component
VVVSPLFYLLRTVGLLNMGSGLMAIYAVVNIPVAFWLLTPFVRFFLASSLTFGDASIPIALRPSR